MRVTNSMVVASTLRDLNRSLSRLQTSQTELSTGRKIRRASDDPTGASAAMTVRNQLRRADQHSRSLTDAQSWLSIADTALVSGLDMLGRVKELAVRAGNDGVANATTRQAIASEVSNLRQELLAIANTQYLDRSIFNGTAAGNAYDAAGVYTGDAAQVTREIAPNTSISVNVTGESIFGSQAAPEGDLFAVLDRLEAAIASGDTFGIAAEHEFLDQATTRVSASAAEIGSRAARLEGVRDRSAVNLVSMREALSQIEDADIAESLIAVKAHENAYTAALQAAAKVIPPSLLDFMR